MNTQLRISGSKSYGWTIYVFDYQCNTFVYAMHIYYADNEDEAEREYYRELNKQVEEQYYEACR